MCGREVPDPGVGPDPEDVADAAGHAEQRTHDYLRYGTTTTTTLSAVLEIATGKVTGLCNNRHRHQEFLAFLKHLPHSYPDGERHLVMDNYASHERVEIQTWLAANPKIQVHFIPTSGSWLNPVEVWFGIIERQAIHRGTFRSPASSPSRDTAVAEAVFMGVIVMTVDAVHN